MIADWDDLRVFLTLSREGNLTATARRLEVSHPTVARRIKSLEDTIGTRLFTWRRGIRAEMNRWFAEESPCDSMA